MQESGEQMIRRWFQEVWNEGREATIDELFPPHCRAHGLGPEPIGPDGFKAFWRSFRSAFTDVNVTVERAISCGEYVSANCTFRGQHVQTGTAVCFTGTCLLRTSEGSFVEAWNTWNMLDFLVQVGAVPGDVLESALRSDTMG